MLLWSYYTTLLPASKGFQSDPRTVDSPANLCYTVGCLPTVEQESRPCTQVPSGSRALQGPRSLEVPRRSIPVLCGRQGGNG